MLKYYSLCIATSKSKWMLLFLTANIETKKNGWQSLYPYPWIKNEKDELIPNANHNPDSGHMSSCDAACLCLSLHQETPRQKAIASSCLCILMSTPWEKYANSLCHQEENRGQESCRYRRGLREEGERKRRDWVKGSVCEFACLWVCCKCVMGVSKHNGSRHTVSDICSYTPFHPLT